MRSNPLVMLLALASLTSASASAHVALTEASAPPGSHYQAHFRVGHGCDGAATTMLSIAIPGGVSDVKAQDAPGWTLETAQSGGRVSAVTWKGGSLDGKTAGEFAVAMTLPAKPGVLVFPATQTCGTTTENWSDAPVAGGKPANPAPVLYVGQEPPAKNNAAPGGMAPGMVMPPGSHM